MHTPDDKEIMDGMKKENPTEWMNIMRERINQDIISFNDVSATENNEVIMAFTMTREDYLNAIAEVPEEEI